MTDTKVKENDGRAYGFKVGDYDKVICEVGPGTPGGELLRRYWQPVALSSEATSLPKQIRRFGEELILFRNTSGEPGLVYPRCIHRGSSLLYGRVEADGIRCCYHGWKFDNQGRCLEQPAEPQGGVAKDRYRQPWYPVVERYGAIWAYMGPADKQPVPPRFSTLEGLAPDEEVRCWYFSGNNEIQPCPQDYNWFQFFENVVDTYHVAILHSAISGDQFKQELMSLVPKSVRWYSNAEKSSIIADSRRAVPGKNQEYVRIAESMMPNRSALPNFFENGPTDELSITVAIDDQHHVIFQFERAKIGQPSFDFRTTGGFGPEKKLWNEMTDEEHQRHPNDYEAQRSQGQITLHSEENLVRSDTGVGMLRRLFKQQCDIVANGGDPIGVKFEEHVIPMSARSDTIDCEENSAAEAAAV